MSVKHYFSSSIRILVALVLACLPARPLAHGETIADSETKFIAIIPLTGSGAEQGEWARRGFDIARDELAASQSLSIELQYEDSKGGDPATAVQAYRAAQAVKKTSVIFTYGSGVGMALSPLVNADHVIQVGIATATPKYRSEGDFTFRNFPSATLEAAFLARALIEDMRLKKIALINIENDYGVGTVQAVKAAVVGLGGSVAGEDSFRPGETDFKPLLLKLRRTDVEAVYLAVYPSEGALLLKQAKQLGIAKKFVGSVALIGGKDFFQLAGDAADGLLVASSIPASDTEFSRRYQRKYPGESAAQSIYAARAYDALKVVASTLVTCRSNDAECIRDELFKVRNFPGAAGTFSFDSCGDIDSSFALFRIRDRRFETSR